MIIILKIIAVLLCILIIIMCLICLVNEVKSFIKGRKNARTNK